MKLEKWLLATGMAPGVVGYGHFQSNDQDYGECGKRRRKIRMLSPKSQSDAAGPGKVPLIDRNGGGWLRAMPVAVLQGSRLASIKCMTRA